ncbi:MAG: hypothetical protein ACK56I_34310 [bacterium]
MEQLYSQIQKDEDGKLTIQDFIDVWLEAEDILEGRILECIEQVKEFSEQRKVIVQKIQNALNNSKLNVSGITDVKILKII